MSTESKKSGPRFALGVSVVVILALALLAWLHHARRVSNRVLVTNVGNDAPRPILSNNSPIVTNAPRLASVRLEEMYASAKTAPDAQAARQRLAELRAAFFAMPTNAASAAIRQFLDSKADAPTHLGFRLAATGWLDEAPTLRTFLLDELARIDPTAAADYSKIVLASMDSADEWAVALRNLAQGDSSPAGRGLLQQKANEMLRQEAWQQNPSVGFLEAFDVSVFLGGTNLMPALSDLVRRQDNSAVAHAAYLALDRLVINDPALTLGTLAAAPDLMQGRELTRANYFARADVRDPQQRQVLESYLLNPQIGPAELNTFAGIYPNANYMISRNLLTPSPTPDHASLVQRDAESLRVLQDWLADPRFAKVRPDLEKARARLDGFVRQAKGN